MCVPYIDYDTAREKATEGEKRVRGQCALADRLDPRRSRQALGAMCGSFGVNVHRPEGERERERVLLATWSTQRIEERAISCLLDHRCLIQPSANETCSLCDAKGKTVRERTY